MLLAAGRERKELDRLLVGLRVPVAIHPAVLLLQEIAFLNSTP
jgi:hypothetical protein